MIFFDDVSLPLRLQPPNRPLVHSPNTPHQQHYHHRPVYLLGSQWKICLNNDDDAADDNIKKVSIHSSLVFVLLSFHSFSIIFVIILLATIPAAPPSVHRITPRQTRRQNNHNVVHTGSREKQWASQYIILICQSFSFSKLFPFMCSPHTRALTPASFIVSVLFCEA